MDAAASSILLVMLLALLAGGFTVFALYRIGAVHHRDLAHKKGPGRDFKHR